MRPRKDWGKPTAKQRLHQAFWDLVAHHAAESITIGMLTEHAGCNRGTFYYHYTDIYALIDEVVDQSIPRQLPLYMLSRIVGLESFDDMESLYLRLQPQLDQLCILLNNGSSAYVAHRFKRKALKIWSEVYGIDMREMGDARVVFEFTINGMLGLLAYRAECDMRLSIPDMVHALVPEVPQAIAARLRACRGALSACCKPVSIDKDSSA